MKHNPLIMTTPSLPDRPAAGLPCEGENEATAPERSYAELERRFQALEQQYRQLLDAWSTLVRCDQELHERLRELNSVLAQVLSQLNTSPSRAEFDELTLRLTRLSRLLTPIATSLSKPCDS